MIYCIPLDEATEDFYASVARAAGRPIEQVVISGGLCYHADTLRYRRHIS